MGDDPGCALGIVEVCGKQPERLFEDARGAWLVALGVMLLGFIVTHLLHRCSVQVLPESFVTVLLGALMGLILWLSPWAGSTDYLSEGLIRMCFEWMLNLVALPAIIFESGWSLRLRDFVSQFAYIMFFAIFGTVVSVLVVAWLTQCTSSWHGIGGNGNWRAALAYASLISSVDPVSTLATFNALNVDPLLFILVFGESQINDAVAITLFRGLNERGLEEPVKLAAMMCRVLFGSIAMGIGLALLYLLILRFTHMGRSPAQAILFIFTSCFFTFSFAEWMGLSGIITVLFNSISMGAYSGVHLGTEEMALASFLLKQMSSMADTLIFLFCGMVSVFVVMSRGEGALFGAAMSLFCLVGRFAAIVPLGLLSNAIKAVVGKRLPKEMQHMLSWKHMFMMWHSGLRGGVSLVLVMQLDERWVGAENKKKMVNGTFLLVVSYLLCFGSTTGACLRVLGLPVGDMVPQGTTLYGPEDKKGPAWRALRFIRKKVMLPLLVGEIEKGEKHGVLEDVLREALEAEHKPDFGSGAGALNRRACSLGASDSPQRRVSVIQLFGTVDPTHVDALEDIHEELFAQRPAPRRPPHAAACRERSQVSSDSSCGSALTEDEDGSRTDGLEGEVDSDAWPPRGQAPKKPLPHRV